MGGGEGEIISEYMSLWAIIIIIIISVCVAHMSQSLKYLNSPGW